MSCVLGKSMLRIPSCHRPLSLRLASISRPTTRRSLLLDGGNIDCPQRLEPQPRFTRATTTSPSIKPAQTPSTSFNQLSRLWLPLRQDRFLVLLTYLLGVLDPTTRRGIHWSLSSVDTSQEPFLTRRTAETSSHEHGVGSPLRFNLGPHSGPLLSLSCASCAFRSFWF
jgi:hypothetical protein